MEWRFFFKMLVLPPVLPLLLMAAGFVGWRFRPRLGRSLVTTGFVLLWLLSLPVVGSGLLGWLERGYSPVTQAQWQSAQAIVILGGGRDQDAAEYQGDTVNGRTLERLRYGAHLYRLTGLPILLTGGRVYDDELVPESELMAGVMRDEFGVPVQWQEDRSRTTAENAYFSAELLRQNQVHRVLLVTHAWHMPRAERVFQRAGLTVVPAPMDFVGGGDWSWRYWVPSAAALSSSYFALHELLGGWVYRWLGG